MDNHLYLENTKTGEKEYILSFSESITISKGSIIRGNTFKLSVSDKLTFFTKTDTEKCGYSVTIETSK